MLSETTKMVIELAAMLDVERIEAKHAKSVILRRQPFAFVGEQIRPSEVDLFARYQIPEFAQVHESPQDGVARFFLLQYGWMDIGSLYLLSSLHGATSS